MSKMSFKNEKLKWITWADLADYCDWRGNNGQCICKKKSTLTRQKFMYTYMTCSEIRQLSKCAIIINFCILSSTFTKSKVYMYNSIHGAKFDYLQ